MGVFLTNGITNNGRILLSHVQIGAVFTPTKIVMGSGNLSAGTTIQNITEVVEPKQTLTIRKKKRSNDGTVTIGGVYSNQVVSTGFYFRELGLYAKAVYQDGQETAEMLYSYGNAGSTADYMPAYTSGQPVEREIDLVVYIGNDANVDLTLETGIYLTQDQLEDAIREPVQNMEAHIANKEIHSTASIKPSLDVTIPTEGWEEDKAEGSDFPFFIEMSYEGVLGSHNAHVTVEKDSINAAYACGLCPTMETLHNGLKFWSRTIPEAEILCHMTLFGEGGISGGGVEATNKEVTM